ncbi:hypothetical protein EJ02DRAFT_491994 [Clathrospora elynae]|uniref:Uncharacterized protein n=1 Tax=Clathrospora elynae TaxID=706981 RepID=A0A6A5T4U9_9PLEO|nr:hypothetical protein EJ02DRAFT_491994 [Clathrospora elynae]
MVRRKHKDHEDIFVVSPLQANRLHSIATIPGFLPAPDTQGFRKDWMHLREELDSRPILVIPVNDGYRQTGETSRKPTEGLAKKDMPENKEDYKPGLGVGLHWPFMVLDRHDAANLIAYFIDDMVRAPQPVAGKVLCGVDSLLGLGKCAFNASTMKFIPNMDIGSHNGSDNSHYGPHMYVFMDRQKQEFKVNSHNTRARFSEELKQERRRQETQQPLSSVDNLTPDVLRSFSTIDLLITLTAEHRRPGQPPSKGPKPSSSSAPAFEDEDWMMEARIRIQNSWIGLPSIKTRSTNT